MYHVSKTDFASSPYFLHPSRNSWRLSLDFLLRKVLVDLVLIISRFTFLHENTVGGNKVDARVEEESVSIINGRHLQRNPDRHKVSSCPSWMYIQ